jgi:transposase
MVGSNLTDTEVTWSQSLADWTGSHVRAFGFMGAVPYRIVSDNLLSGVIWHTMLNHPLQLTDPYS